MTGQSTAILERQHDQPAGANHEVAAQLRAARANLSLMLLFVLALLVLVLLLWLLLALKPLA